MKTVFLFIGLTLAAVGLVFAASGGKKASKGAKPAVKTEEVKAAPEAPKAVPMAIVTTASGLKYEDIKVGTGPSPEKGRMVSVHYVGTLADGKKFDSSRDRGQPFEFMIGVGQVIRGWDEGVSTMKVGGVRKLIIPPQLGYGASGIDNVIPPNAELHFEVELIGIR